MRIKDRKTVCAQVKTLREEEYIQSNCKKKKKKKKRKKKS
jgi:hypothetical protein